MDSTHDDDDDGDDGDGDDDQPFFRVLVECFEKNFTFIKLTKKNKTDYNKLYITIHT